MKDALAEQILKYPPYKFSFLPQSVIKALWPRFLELDRWAFARFEFFDLQKQKRIQRERLSGFLKRAIRYTEYWGGIAETSRFEHLPPMTRELLRSKTMGHFSSKIVPLWRRDLITTSGTTTTPCKFYGDKLCFLRMEAMMKCVMGFNDNKKLLRVNLNFPPFKPLGTIFLFSEVDSVDTNARRLVEVLKRVKPVHIFSTPSNALQLGRIFELKKIKYNFNALTVSGETLLEKDRAFLENIFSCPVFSLYASREAAGPIAYECGQRNGYHINAASFLVEILDDNNKEVGEGVDGNIAITMFENEVMPFIRYKIGDRGYVTSKPCRCGRQSPRLFFQGREAHFVKLKNGGAVPLLSVVGVVRDSAPSILQYRFAQKIPGEIVVYITPLFGALSSGEVKNILNASQERFRDRLILKMKLVSKSSGKNILFESAV